MKSSTFMFIALIPLLSLIVFGNGHMEFGLDPLNKFIPSAKRLRGGLGEKLLSDSDGTYIPVIMGDQEGLREADKIGMLPGQPNGVDFEQFSGYVTVDPTAGRALFYYFTEAPQDAATKPLVLWLNGGPMYSSFGNGAMMELGPFRVNSDGKTLSRNYYSWNEVANVIFLESPSGIGYSYSNTTSDYGLCGDTRTARDSYTFLVNWLERFPQYKSRDFYIAGESYAGHYVPQLAQLIMLNNEITNQTVINLRGIAMANPLIDDETYMIGFYDFYWAYALISDEIHEGITLSCNFSGASNLSDLCLEYIYLAMESIENISRYDIYAPLCNATTTTQRIGGFDPCSDQYIESYLNLPQVQAALHANITSIPYPWSFGSSVIQKWSDSPLSILPIINKLMESNIRVWIFRFVRGSSGLLSSVPWRFSC